MTSSEIVSRNRRLLSRATFFSIVWIVCCLCVLIFANGGADAGFLKNIQALRPNEWGDFFAGAFAPLAFVWLVATVWIQHDEFRMQQEELAQTRHEFELNREVLKSQAEEAKKQAQYIGAQTEMLRREELERAVSENDIIFNANLLELSRHLKKYNNTAVVRVGSVQKYMGIELSEDEYREYDIVRDVSHYIIDIVNEIRHDPSDTVRLSDPNKMQVDIRYIKICVQCIENMSNAGKVRAGILRLPDLLEAMNHLLDLDQAAQKKLLVTTPKQGESPKDSPQT